MFEPPPEAYPPPGPEEDNGGGGGGGGGNGPEGSDSPPPAWDPCYEDDPTCNYEYQDDTTLAGERRGRAVVTAVGSLAGTCMSLIRDSLVHVHVAGCAACSCVQPLL